MTKSILIKGGATVVGALSLWFLPRVVDSYLVFGVITTMLVVSVLYGWLRKQWLLAALIGTYVAVADLFGLARAEPALLWLAILLLWIGGTWLIGYIGNQPSRIFQQGLASFLMVEVFLILLLWPINIISKSVIAVSFAFFMWQEFVRTVPNRQRVQESVVPFFLIIILMTLTGHWFTF